MCVRTWELPQHSDFFRTSAKFKVVWSQETDVSPTKKKKKRRMAGRKTYDPLRTERKARYCGGAKRARGVHASTRVGHREPAEEQIPSGCENGEGDGHLERWQQRISTSMHRHRLDTSGDVNGTQKPSASMFACQGGSEPKPWRLR